MSSLLRNSTLETVFRPFPSEERLGAKPLPLALELEMRQRQRAISGIPVRYHMKVRKCWLQCLLCDSISKRYCTTWGRGGGCIPNWNWAARLYRDLKLIAAIAILQFGHLREMPSSERSRAPSSCRGSVELGFVIGVFAAPARIACHLFGEPSFENHQEYNKSRTQCTVSW